jgi:hypothetical protein
VELPEWKSFVTLGHSFGVVIACDVAEAEEGVGEAVLTMVSYHFPYEGSVGLTIVYSPSYITAVYVGLHDHAWSDFPYKLSVFVGIFLSVKVQLPLLVERV